MLDIFGRYFETDFTFDFGNIDVVSFGEYNVGLRSDSVCRHFEPKKLSIFSKTYGRSVCPSVCSDVLLHIADDNLTHYRPAMPFGIRKFYFRGSFLFSTVKI